jgi:hypothetical protein
VSLLPAEIALLLELPLRLSDLRRLFQGKYVDHQQWPHLGLPGLRQDSDDVISGCV